MWGPTAPGKSTTIRMMLDIFAPDRGTVEVFGAPIDDAARRRIGYLPEERGLYPGLRIPPILKYMAELKGVPSQEAPGLADAALERLGLTEHRTKKVGELSRGLRQLLAVCGNDPAQAGLPGAGRAVLGPGPGERAADEEHGGRN